MHVNDLCLMGLLDIQFSKLLKESLFLAYMGNEMQDRPERLFTIMKNYDCEEAKLENIMQMGGRDLPDIADFIPLWIEFLGSRSEFFVGELLDEAMDLVGDANQVREYAGKFAVSFPELYLWLMQGRYGKADDARQLQIGMEALAAIPDSYVVRGDIALLTAACALRLDKRTIAEECWLEAFRSETSVVNYMRIRMLTDNWRLHEKQLAQICEDAYRRGGGEVEDEYYYWTSHNVRRNSLDDVSYCRMLFFEEKFEQAMQEGMTEGTKFMKEGTALFLLLLWNGKKWKKGISEICALASFACSFRTDKYLKGTDIVLPDDADAGNQAYFRRVFCSWKETVSVSDEEAARWLQRMEELIQFMTAEVMKANLRVKYGECASFIAALGEVRESRGQRGAREDIMNGYWTKYARRSAFRRELKNFQD